MKTISKLLRLKLVKTSKRLKSEGNMGQSPVLVVNIHDYYYDNHQISDSLETENIIFRCIQHCSVEVSRQQQV